MFSFAMPWVLCLLPVPFLIRWLLANEKNTNQAALTLPFFDGIEQALSNKRPLSKLKYGLLWLLWINLLLALAGPQMLGDKQLINREGRNIMLALDVSGSMQIDDMELNGQRVTRLAVVKQSAHEFVNKREGDRLSLILFGTNAHLQTPLTFDLKTVHHMIEDASIGLAGQTTSIGDAIGIAIKKLESAKGGEHVLILLTDGSNNSGVLTPMQAARIAKEKGIKIYTIGLGSTRMLVQNIFGLQAVNPSQDLDEDTLKAIAKETNGAFFRARDPKALNNIYATISQLEPVVDKANVYRPVKNYYVYPLALSFICYLLLCLNVSGYSIRLKKGEKRHG
jgi:Ca-activated chloride channel family protein